jgi:hypothetical protein
VSVTGLSARLVLRLWRRVPAGFAAALDLNRFSTLRISSASSSCSLLACRAKTIIRSRSLTLRVGIFVFYPFVTSFEHFILNRVEVNSIQLSNDPVTVGE